MWNTSNPAEIYTNTTWELLATDKYLKTTTGTPLSTGGSNSFILQRLIYLQQNCKLIVFHSRGTMNITGNVAIELGKHISGGAFYIDQINSINNNSGAPDGSTDDMLNFDASRTWSGSTSSASPYTQNLGSGTAITLNPSYITIRTWKRLS